MKLVGYDGGLWRKQCPPDLEREHTTTWNRTSSAGSRHHPQCVMTRPDPLRPSSAHADRDAVRRPHICGERRVHHRPGTPAEEAGPQGEEIGYVSPECPASSGRPGSSLATAEDFGKSSTAQPEAQARRDAEPSGECGIKPRFVMCHDKTCPPLPTQHLTPPVP